MKQFIYIILVMMMIVACRDADLEQSSTALLINPDVESHDEVQRTISAALNGVEVLLADDVFTKNSVLVVERNVLNSIDRPPEMGRDLGRPSRFQLITNGTDCVIVDEQSGVHWPLANVQCAQE